jgi:hypothetical protein
MVISQFHYLAFGWGEVFQCLHDGTGELLPSNTQLQGLRRTL